MWMHDPEFVWNIFACPGKHNKRKVYFLSSHNLKTWPHRLSAPAWPGRKWSRPINVSQWPGSSFELHLLLVASLLACCFQVHLEPSRGDEEELSVMQLGKLRKRGGSVHGERGERPCYYPRGKAEQAEGKHGTLRNCTEVLLILTQTSVALGEGYFDLPGLHFLLWKTGGSNMAISQLPLSLNLGRPWPSLGPIIMENIVWGFSLTGSKTNGKAAMG